MRMPRGCLKETNYCKWLPHISLEPSSQMLFLLFIFYLLQYDDAQGLPVPIVDRATSPSTPETSIGKRSLLTIVWSCVSVVVICAWVSVHPNVPPRSQKGALLQRLRMMIWTIIAPELVLAWAVRQWFAARTVADRFKCQLVFF